MVTAVAPVVAASVAAVVDENDAAVDAVEVTVLSEVSVAPDAAVAPVAEVAPLVVTEAAVVESSARVKRSLTATAELPG